jgi:hypothetical protein
LIADFDFERVIADRSYDAEEFLKKIAEKEAEAVIRPARTAKNSVNTTAICTRSGT